MAILLIVLLGTSCNVVRMQTRQQTRTLERNGYAARTFTDAGGAHFAWARDTGKEKILLLHGYTGTGRIQWTNTAERLRKDYDAIMPDLLCHGNSAKWDTTNSGTSLDAQVAHVVLILDSLGIHGPITVVGNSYGGGVAARLAEQHPDRVKKLVLYDALVSDYTAAMADSCARSVGAEGMLAVMRTPSLDDLKYGLRLSLFHQPPIPRFVLRQVYEAQVKPYRPAQITLIKDLMAHEDRFATHRYAWPMPVFVIWGERDRLIPNSVAAAVMRRNDVPADHISIVPRTGHVANLERPKAFERTLREVLVK